MIKKSDFPCLVKNDNFAKFKSDEESLEDVTFYRFDQEKNLEEIIISEKVTVSDEGWIFINPKNITGPRLPIRESFRFILLVTKYPEKIQSPI